MKRCIFLAILLLVIPIAQADVNVQKTMPEAVKPNETFEINVQVTLTNETQLDLSEMLPENWQIIDWDMEGTEKYTTDQKTTKYLQKTREVYLWSFRNISTNQINLNYQIKAKEKGNFEFISLWVTPSNFDSQINSISVADGEVVKEKSMPVWQIGLIAAVIIAAILIFFYLKFGKKGIPASSRLSSGKGKRPILSC